jgi:hypothetical protein
MRAKFNSVIDGSERGKKKSTTGPPKFTFCFYRWSKNPYRIVMIPFLVTREILLSRPVLVSNHCASLQAFETRVARSSASERLAASA